MSEHCKYPRRYVREINRMWDMFEGASEYIGPWAVKLANHRPESPRAVLNIFPIANSLMVSESSETTVSPVVAAQESEKNITFDQSL